MGDNSFLGSERPIYSSFRADYCCRFWDKLIFVKELYPKVIVANALLFEKMLSLIWVSLT